MTSGGLGIFAGMEHMDGVQKAAQSQIHIQSADQPHEEFHRSGLHNGEWPHAPASTFRAIENSVKVSTDTGAVLAAYVMTRGHGSNSSWRKAEVCGRFEHVPRKIRQLVTDLEKAGFVLVPGGKGSHRKFRHPKLPGSLILSGQSGDDAKHYQERQVRNALRDMSK